MPGRRATTPGRRGWRWLAGRGGWLIGEAAPEGRIRAKPGAQHKSLNNQVHLIGLPLDLESPSPPLACEQLIISLCWLTKAACRGARIRPEPRPLLSLLPLPLFGDI